MSLLWAGLFQQEQAIVTCVPSTDVALHVVLLHADVVTDAAAEWEHPLLLVHMEWHVADKLSIQLRLETTHMAAGQRTEKEKKENGESERRETVGFSVISFFLFFFFPV